MVISKEIIKDLKKKYPKGTRVQLIHMEDDYGPKPGTCGTVFGVDDIGSIMVNWDNGSSLSVLYRIDKVKII